MEIHEFLGSFWNQTSRFFGSNWFRLRDGGKGRLIPETLRYLCTPALPCLGDVKAPPLLKPGVSWWNRRFKQVEKKEREHRKWLRIIQFLIVLRLVLMLVGGKKLKREVFTRFSFISASIFPFQNSVGAMQWGDVVIFVDGKWCQMWSAIRPSFHWWYLSSWACSIHLLCWVVSSHLHRWLQDSKKHITACWQMPSFFCSRFHGFLLRFRCFFGTLEVSTPHTTQLLKDKEMKLIYWQLFKKYWHVLLFKERFPLFFAFSFEGPPSGDACFSNPEEELCKSRQWFTWVKARCWDVSVMRLGVPSSIESQQLALQGKLGFWNSLYSFG